MVVVKKVEYTEAVMVESMGMVMEAVEVVVDSETPLALKAEVRELEMAKSQHLQQRQAMFKEISERIQSSVGNELDQLANKLDIVAGSALEVLICHHILAEKHNKLIGYSRILEKGNLYSNYSSIGRVLVDNKERGHKVGEKIVKFSIKIIKQKYKEAPIKISAQTYLLDFYKKLGFHHKGRDYLEDGIPHSSMYLE